MLLVYTNNCKVIFYIKIKVPTRVREAMQMQVEAERKKRASILESEGLDFLFLSD